MPAISTRQHVLRGAFKYAQKLQGWRRKYHKESELLDELDYTVDNDEFGVTTDDRSSLSTLSSFSSSLSSLPSLSSLSSLSLMEDIDPNTMTEFSEEEEEWEDQNYMMHYRASCAQIAEILSTWVLFPNRVHKLSQLYKKDDPKHFWCNIRVSPSTFDELLA
ncbi:hypothetical protein HHX47_DHR8000235 [Lentinula edodes]|nr:hypothetical protein HHX47_DHR8000235 [Lentinula edodes]